MDNPITRKEMYLAAAAGEAVDLPDPITREEIFLKMIADTRNNGNTGGNANLTVSYEKKTAKIIFSGKASSGDSSGDSGGEDSGGDTGEDTSIPATGITLNTTSETVAIGGTLTLEATVTPADSTDTVVWKTNNSTIATVENGVVTGVAEGTTSITATAGSKSAVCIIEVAVTTNDQWSESGYTLDVTSGEVIANAGSFVTNDFSPIEAGNVYKVSGKGNGSFPRITLYKEDGTYVCGGGGSMMIVAILGTSEITKAKYGINATDSPESGFSIEKLDGYLGEGATVVSNLPVQRKGSIAGTQIGSVEIPVEAGKTYVFSSGSTSVSYKGIFQYDAAGNFLTKSSSSTDGGDLTATMEADTAYVVLTANYTNSTKTDPNSFMTFTAVE